MLMCLSYSIGLLIESKKKWENAIYIVFTALFIFALLISNTMSCIVGLAFVLTITLTNDKYGSRRIYIWKKTLEIVPKYIIHGVGIDCFHKAFDGKALTVVDGKYSALYDKAHNEYLQILVTQGIFALVSYLFIFGTSLFQYKRH